MPARQRERARRRRQRARAVASATLGALLLAGSLGGLAWVGAAQAPTSGARERGPSSREQALSAADISPLEPIVIALPQLPRKFDPLDEMEPWAERIADDLIFEGLVRRTSDRYPWVEPAIADRCEVDRELAVLTISCHIPTGIRFHDGSELSMTDVEYSLRYWLHEHRSDALQRRGLANYERVEIVDGPAEGRDRGRWVKLRFNKPEPLALEAISAIKIVPIAAHSRRASQFTRAPIGTGPMRLTSLETDRIVLERFDDYRDPRRQSPTRKLVVRAINDGAAALTALRRGDIHLLAQVAPHHVPVELGRPGMSARLYAWLVSPASYDVLLWNLRKGVSANPGVRAALHDAVPYAAIARQIYDAPGLPTQAPVDLHEPAPIDLELLAGIRIGEPLRAGLLPRPPLEADRRGSERAAAGLDALGFRARAKGMRRGPGGPLRVILAWDGDEGRASSIGTAIRRAWQMIGVSSPDTSTSWRYLLSVLSRGDFRVAMLHFGGHSDEDLFHMFHSRGALNVAGVADEQLDAALDDYRAALDRRARDLAKVHIAERLAELRVVSVLYAPAHVMLSSRRLTQIEFVDDLPRLDTLALTSGALDWGNNGGFCVTCE
ncbi:ABC transporter substrate-binding protein [Enhygromyxa salina]|uniref:Bacterial extracellular solute-binding protein, family 5 Middle n=1 Tax=Enhygromyxa salina TaxID=215803 RepID=A0A2S9YPX2_9BACT|nr:ABC transporter substrate-binding protein [Enhygromyxa salina]PRQ07122.1 Bacterial extracellular solute-binding protein, family 5 Middle [Enhygromyxa salina]